MPLFQLPDKWDDEADIVVVGAGNGKNARGNPKDRKRVRHGNLG